MDTDVREERVKLTTTSPWSLYVTIGLLQTTEITNTKITQKWRF